MPFRFYLLRFFIVLILYNNVILNQSRYEHKGLALSTLCSQPLFAHIHKSYHLYYACYYSHFQFSCVHSHRVAILFLFKAHRPLLLFYKSFSKKYAFKSKYIMNRVSNRPYRKSWKRFLQGIFLYRFCSFYHG